MIKDAVSAAMNKQIGAEYFSAYLYLSMSAWCDHAGFPGFANWMHVQAKEELAHGTHLFEHLLERDAPPRLTAIEGPPTSFESLIDVFEQTLAHERRVTGYIDDIATLAMREGDHASYNFMLWYINEQVEEEATAGLLLQKLRIIGGNAAMLYALDTEMAARVFVDPFAAATN